VSAVEALGGRLDSYRRVRPVFASRPASWASDPGVRGDWISSYTRVRGPLEGAGYVAVPPADVVLPPSGTVGRFYDARENVDGLGK